MKVEHAMNCMPEITRGSASGSSIGIADNTQQSELLKIIGVHDSNKFTKQRAAETKKVLAKSCTTTAFLSN